MLPGDDEPPAPGPYLKGNHDDAELFWLTLTVILTAFCGAHILNRCQSAARRRDGQSVLHRRRSPNGPTA